MSTTFMKVQDVADELGVSKSYAYKIVQKLNDELKANVVGAEDEQYPQSCNGSCKCKFNLRIKITPSVALKMSCARRFFFCFAY